MLLLALLLPKAAEAGPTLLLYGGQNQKQFLGCLNCSELDSKSVHNDLGPYGSDLSQTSIKNGLSPYGSPFSSYSACNELAMNPPIIVDPKGNSYGRLTMNQVHRHRTGLSSMLRWLAVVCAQN